ncbi:glycerophosphodiester phosphodiesterase [Ensifer sp. LC54]|nr:glycerophosphodiester phosphodiesterase [Ensifer sp. LC54]OCP27355.1 glycerophosphodiester phosphodiesterase [Ensifer sp. LC384]
MNVFSGLSLTHLGHITRLKWHRLRRHRGDPLFSPAVMTEGFRLGASMEIDLRVRADGGFAVLHDDVLDGETTGSGPVHRMAAADLRPLRMKTGGHAITLSEDLATMLTEAHPDALLQFDMKDDFATVGERGVEHLSLHFRDVGRQIIVSGADLDLILAIKRRLPDLKRGIDPTDRLIEIHSYAGLAAVERELIADLDGPTEPDTIYLAWGLVLQAARNGLDLIGLCHDKGTRVDAWTYNLDKPDAGFAEEEWQEFSSLMARRPDQITTDVAPAIERAWLRRVEAG